MEGENLGRNTYHVTYNPKQWVYLRMKETARQIKKMMRCHDPLMAHQTEDGACGPYINLGVPGLQFSSQTLLFPCGGVMSSGRGGTGGMLAPECVLSLSTVIIGCLSFLILSQLDYSEGCLTPACGFETFTGSLENM